MGRAGAVATVVASYLAGAFPTAELVGRAYGRDVRREGSGNPGATNTYRVAGRQAAAIVTAVDVAKGAFGALAGRGGGPQLSAACGVAAIVGHCFGPTGPGKGGKGVATTAGVVLALDPPLGISAVGAWAAVATLTRRPSLASIATAAMLPMAAGALRRPRPELAAVSAASAIIFIRHADNISRLLRGQEDPVREALPA